MVTELKDKTFVFVTIHNHNLSNSFLQPYMKQKIEIEKSCNLQKAYEIVLEKYPYFLEFYYKNLKITKQQ